MRWNWRSLSVRICSIIISANCHTLSQLLNKHAPCHAASYPFFDRHTHMNRHQHDRSHLEFITDQKFISDSSVDSIRDTWRHKNKKLTFWLMRTTSASRLYIHLGWSVNEYWLCLTRVLLWASSSRVAHCRAWVGDSFFVSRILYTRPYMYYYIKRYCAHVFML